MNVDFCEGLSRAVLGMLPISLSVFILFLVVRFIRIRKIEGRRGTVYRDGTPVLFWILVLGMSAVAIMWILLGLLFLIVPLPAAV